jgi:hypothetical protein
MENEMRQAQEQEEKSDWGAYDGDGGGGGGGGGDGSNPSGGGRSAPTSPARVGEIKNASMMSGIPSDFDSDEGEGDKSVEVTTDAILHEASLLYDEMYDEAYKQSKGAMNRSSGARSGTIGTGVSSTPAPPPKAPPAPAPTPAPVEMTEDSVVEGLLSQGGGHDPVGSVDLQQIHQFLASGDLDEAERMVIALAENIENSVPGA